jgi:hypothetical protein
MSKIRRVSKYKYKGDSLTLEELKTQVHFFIMRNSLDKLDDGSINWNFVDADMCITFGKSNTDAEINKAMTEVYKSLK